MLILVTPASGTPTPWVDSVARARAAKATKVDALLGASAEAVAKALQVERAMAPKGVELVRVDVVWWGEAAGALRLVRRVAVVEMAEGAAVGEGWALEVAAVEMA